MHDANGTKLEVGDRVLIPAEITSLSIGTADYCNVAIKSTLGRRPDGQRETMSLNTGVLVKASGADKPLLI